MADRSLRDRSTLRQPRRFEQSSSSSDESSVETRIFRQLEGALEGLDIDSSASSSATEETLNLAELQAAIENAELEEEERRANNFVFPEFQQFQQHPPQVSQVARPPMAAARTFLLDPFRGNINPGETEGRKLYLSATKEREDDKKFTVRSDTAKAFMDAMVDDSTHFGWESLVDAIRIDGGNDQSILRDIRKLKIDNVLREAKKTWNDWTTDATSAVPRTRTDFVVLDINPASTDPAHTHHEEQFYRRVRSKMIWKRVVGSISQASKNALMAKKDYFRWQTTTGSFEYDGPTALFLLLEAVNPNTRVGVATLKKKLRDMRLGGYNHNVRELLTAIQTTYTEIEELGFKHDDIVMDMFTALLSTKNQVFKDFIQRKKDSWETGTDFSMHELAEDALNKYNNMLEQRQWQQKESADTKLVALLSNHLKTGKTGGSSGGNSSKPSNNVEAWRMKKKGDSVDRDGKTWYWCPDHKLRGVFDGLYVLHRPGKGHDEWAAKKKERQDKRKQGKSSSSSFGGSTGGSSGGSTGSGNAKKLALSDKLKTVLVTKLSLSDSDAQALVGDIVGDLN